MYISNRGDNIGFSGVINGFIKYLIYNSEASIKNVRITSSFLPLCSNNNIAPPGVI